MKLTYLEQPDKLLTPDYEVLELHLAFLAEHEKHMIQLIELFELEQKPLTQRVFNAVTDFSSALKGGVTNVTFRSKTDSLLSNGFSNQETAKAIEHFMEAFRLGSL